MDYLPNNGRATRLYSNNVRIEIIVPLIKFKGATASITKLCKEEIPALILLPMAMMASKGKWKSWANLGNKYTALNRLPKIVKTAVPIANPHRALVRLFLV